MLEPKPCPCSSGEPRRELRDAAGIFCQFVCERCEEAKRGFFNPRIFDRGTAYAATGDEEDLLREGSYAR